VEWEDGGTQTLLISQKFDDGSSFTDLNQRIRLFLSLDLISGGQNDSRFIVEPLESGAINEDATWSGIPDIKSSTFPTLSIGWDNSLGRQANSNYEYLRVYEWDGVKPTITDSDDVDTYLAGQTPLFSVTSSPTVDRDSIDENTSLQNALEKNASSIQLLKSFDNWHEVGGTNEPAFQNSWVNFGTSDRTAGFYKDSMGWVHLKGKIATGTLSNDAFQLPNGYLQHDRLQADFPVISNGSIGLVRITATGGVQPIAPSDNTYVSLEGISFYAGF